jgi:O-succinylbenzoic acid--CoA ligase
VSYAGAVIAAVHPRLTTGEAVGLLRRAGCARVICDEAWRTAHPEVDEEAVGAPLLALEELLYAAPLERERVASHVELSAPHSLLYTSGTTGAPKMAMLTWGNQLWAATGSAVALGHLPGDVWGAPLPLCHVGGLAIVMRCVTLGTTIRLYGARFDASRVADDIAGGRISLVSLVPTMCWQVLEALGSRRADPRFRGILLGGGPIPPTLLNACAERELPVAPTYGMTEGCSQLVTARLDERGASRRNAPLVWTELAIAGDTERGELLVSGPTVSPGYIADRRPGEPIRVVSGRDEAGWLATGDWVELGPRGLQVLDRRTDLIVSGGENVYPAEVEAALLVVEGVAQACVVGLPDERWGHKVVAVLVGHADDQEVIARCRAQLAGYKQPRELYWWEELPRSSLDKVSRSQVRERLLRELDASRRAERR